MLYELRAHHVTDFLWRYLNRYSEKWYWRGYDSQHTVKIIQALEEISSDPNNKVKVIAKKVGLDKICSNCPNNLGGICDFEELVSETDDRALRLPEKFEGTEYDLININGVYTVEKLQRMKIIDGTYIGANKN